MLNCTHKIVAAALVATCVAVVRPASADDRGRQFAGDLLQAIATGLNNGGGGGPVFVPSQPPVVVPVFDPNPVVSDTGVNITATGIDPFGRPVVQTDQSTIHQSALDPNRGTVDPGSVETSSSIVMDSFGNTVRETTTSWTSFGVPHSETTRQIISQSASSVVIDQQQQIQKSAHRSRSAATRVQQPRRSTRPQRHR